MSSEITSEECNLKQLSSHFQYQEIVVDGNKYLIGVRKIDDCRQILLTDLTNFYEEKLSKEDCMKRVEELNPLLPDCDIDEILNHLLLNIPSYATSCTLQCIELENQIEDGRFWFHLKFTKADAQQFHDQHTESLYISLSELHHRYNYLMDLLKKKDKEIDEYKAQGVSIMKKSVVTEPFSENLFRMLKKVKPMGKMCVFLKTMNFFNSIDTSVAKEDLQKREPSNSKSEVITEVSNKLSTKKKVAVKRPPSSDIRCAVVSKIGKKTKQSKPNSFLKQI